MHGDVCLSSCFGVWAVSTTLAAITAFLSCGIHMRSGRWSSQVYSCNRGWSMGMDSSTWHPHDDMSLYIDQGRPVVYTVVLLNMGRFLLVRSSHYLSRAHWRSQQLSSLYATFFCTHWMSVCVSDVHSTVCDLTCPRRHASNMWPVCRLPVYLCTPQHGKTFSLSGAMSLHWVELISRSQQVSCCMWLFVQLQLNVCARACVCVCVCVPSCTEKKEAMCVTCEVCVCAQTSRVCVCVCVCPN